MYTAYFTVEFSWCLGLQSWVYIVKRRGLSTQPWGTWELKSDRQFQTILGLFVKDMCPLRPWLHTSVCVCVSMLEWVSSEMQMRGEDGIMARWRQPSICALNKRTSSFADVKTYSSYQQTGWKGRGGVICHAGLSTVTCSFIIGSRACLDICMRVKLCSRHQVSSAGFILGSIDRWSESLWLWKGAGEEQVQEETLFDAGAEGMTWNGKRRHSGIYGIELWVVAHEKQVKDNTVCCRGMHFQPRWDEFRVISHHIYIYTHICGQCREREQGRVLGCSGNGGRVYRDVSAAKSDVINVVVAWENTQPCTLRDTQCVCVCVLILHTTALLDFHASFSDEVDLNRRPLDKWPPFTAVEGWRITASPPDLRGFLLFNGAPVALVDFHGSQSTEVHRFCSTCVSEFCSSLTYRLDVEKSVWFKPLIPTSIASLV